ncbi:MAG: hypothetical protein J6K39_00100 [Clostridia bacterium]|nr:hypothetical protein [Clostridia bacterium]
MIPVCFSGNKRIFEGLLLSVMSLAKNTDEELNIYILTMDLSDENTNFLPFTDEQMAILDSVLQEKNPASKTIKVDVTELYKTHLRHGKNHENGYTPYAMLRLLLDLVPGIPDKMIYLDIDTMCCNDIREFYDIIITDHDFGATKDYMGRFWIRYNYCNSGSLVMNMKRIKENGLFEKCRKMVCKKRMLMPDQTALNKYGNKLYLPFKFNEQRKIKADTVIKHFCKGIVFFLPFGFHIYNIKQWNRKKVHKSLKIFEFDGLYTKVDELKLKHPNCF